MKPLHLLAVLAALYTGWQLAPDGRVAFYAMSGFTIAFLCLVILDAKGSHWAPACIFGAVCGVMQGTCGIAFHTYANGKQFLCDIGTGFPTSGLIIAIAAGAISFYARRLRGRTDRP